jgi:hypothetical protein
MRKAIVSEPSQQLSQNEEVELARIIPIRTETTLSRRPIHRLAKKGEIKIKESRRNERGQVVTTWEIRNPPGPLAYKVDKLVIDRRIDAARPDVPKLLKIGSLREMCAELDISEGKGTQLIKEALYENAGALIIARLDYSGHDGSERYFEFGSSRYAVYFVGEKLPNGKRADAVYIRFHDDYYALLTHSQTRPLDYEYLKALPPAAQRIYELISFALFGAIKHGRKYATYIYSELCKSAPLTRYYDWERVRPQMWKVHQPHKESGYLNGVEFQETTDSEGQPDWLIKYTPGKKARQEYKEFTTKKLTAQTSPSRPRLVETRTDRGGGTPERTPEDSTLIEKLMSFGIDESRAARLVESDRAECELWAAAWPHQNQKGMENPPAVLIRFIETKRRPLPKGYKDAIEKEQRAKEAEWKKAIEEAQNAHFARCVGAYWRDYLMSELEALKESHAEAFDELQKRLSMWDEYTERHDIALMRTITTEDFVAENPSLGILSFWQWDEEKNPHPFKLAD